MRPDNRQYSKIVITFRSWRADRPTHAHNDTCTLHHTHVHHSIHYTQVVIIHYISLSGRVLIKSNWDQVFQVVQELDQFAIVSLECSG